LNRHVDGPHDVIFTMVGWFLMKEMLLPPLYPS